MNKAMGRQACRGGLQLTEAEEAVSGSTEDMGCLWEVTTSPSVWGGRAVSEGLVSDGTFHVLTPLWTSFRGISVPWSPDKWGVLPEAQRRYQDESPRVRHSRNVSQKSHRSQHWSEQSPLWDGRNFPDSSIGQDRSLCGMQRPFSQHGGQANTFFMPGHCLEGKTDGFESGLSRYPCIPTLGWVCRWAMCFPAPKGIRGVQISSLCTVIFGA